jgi:hypothetical protein
VINTYRIPDRNLPALREKLEKLNRRAARLGVEPSQFEAQEVIA